MPSPEPLPPLPPTLELHTPEAEQRYADVVAAAEVYFTLGERLELDWLRGRVLALPRDTRWEAMARAALRDDVYAEQAGLTATVLRAGAYGQSAEARVASWLAQNDAAIERSLQVLADIRAGGALDLARLSVAVRELRNLIHSSESPVPAADAGRGIRTGTCPPRYARAGAAGKGPGGQPAGRRSAVDSLGGRA